MSARLGLALGTTLAGAIAVWWLGASRVAMQNSGDTALLAAQALFVLGVLRGMLIAVAAPRVAADDGYAAGARCAIPVVTTAWPVVALVWTASAASLLQTLLVEVALLCGALAAPAVGQVMARHRRSALHVPLASLAGIALACCVWLLAMHWRQLAGWAHA